MNSLIRKLLDRIAAKTTIPFRVVLANGQSWSSRPGEPVVTLTFKTAGAQWRTLAFGHIGFLESFFDGTVDVEGDLPAMFRAASDSRFDEHRGHPLVGIRNRWHEFRFANKSIEQTRANARFHYGPGHRLLPAVARSRLADVHVRVLEGGDAHDRGGAGQQDRARLPQGQAQARRERRSTSAAGFGGFMLYAAERYGVHGATINTTNEQVDWLRDEVAGGA